MYRECYLVPTKYAPPSLELFHHTTFKKTCVEQQRFTFTSVWIWCPVTEQPTTVAEIRDQTTVKLTARFCSLPYAIPCFTKFGQATSKRETDERNFAVDQTNINAFHTYFLFQVLFFRIYSFSINRINSSIESIHHLRGSHFAFVLVRFAWRKTQVPAARLWLDVSQYHSQPYLRTINRTQRDWSARRRHLPRSRSRPRRLRRHSTCLPEFCRIVCTPLSPFLFHMCSKRRHFIVICEIIHLISPVYSLKHHCVIISTYIVRTSHLFVNNVWRRQLHVQGRKVGFANKETWEFERFAH